MKAPYPGGLGPKWRKRPLPVLTSQTPESCPCPPAPPPHTLSPQQGEGQTRLLGDGGRGGPLEDLLPALGLKEDQPAACRSISSMCFQSSCRGSHRPLR